MKVVEKQNILSKRVAFENAGIIFIEMCTGVYFVKKNRYDGERVDTCVDSRIVAGAFDNHERVLVERMDKALVVNYDIIDGSRC
jgi:hypothetical protein